MAHEEEKTLFQELSEVATFLYSLNQDDFKRVGLSYFETFKNLFIFHLTESLWVFVITKTNTYPTIERTPSLLDAFKSAVGQSSDDQSSKNVSIQTIFDSVKENVILKPFSLILQKVLKILEYRVLQLKTEYHKIKNKDIKTELKNIVHIEVEEMFEVKELRKKIEETMGGKRKRTRARYRRKRRKTKKRIYKGGNLIPSPQIDELIKKMCDKEVNRFFP